MKKYEKLSLNEAIDNFIVHHKKKLPADIQGKIAVSVIIPTHRIAPDNKQDSINLKNQVTEVEKLLHEKLDKREVAVIMDHIKKAQELIDHSHNLDSLVLYANENFAAVIKLPVTAKEEAMVGPHFDVRPLYKARQQRSTYYIITVSRHKIRLIEAVNNRLIKEIHNQDFPYENTEYYVTDPEKLAQDSFEENQIKEFFNVADKRFKKYLNENPLPIVLAGDTKMTAYYKGMMDDDRMYIGSIQGSFDQTPDHELIPQTYYVVQQFMADVQKKYQAVLDAAQSNSTLVSDYNEIFRLVNQGNVKTLFIGENFRLNGMVEDNYLDLSPNNELRETDEDITLDMIEKVEQNDGQIIFLPDDMISSYQGMALVKRY